MQYKFILAINFLLALALHSQITAAACTHVASTFTISPTTAQTIPAGSSADYTLTLTNNDSSACSPSTYAILSETQVTWLRATLSTTSVVLNPGQTQVINLTILSSTATFPNTYSVVISETNKTVPGNTLSVKALFTSTSSATSTGLTPLQVYRAYGFRNLAFKGDGQTIAIVSAYDYPNAEADLAVFSTNFALPACTSQYGCFKKIYANGVAPKADPAWSIEMAADLQWAHAIAPNAALLLVEAPDASIGSILNAVRVAVANGATVISMGWGIVEYASETSLDPTFNSPNVAFTAASGSTGNGTLYPAVSPYVLAVGGTQITVDASGNYLGETAWAGSGGGLSPYETEPSYQINFPVPNNPNHQRAIPDVAFNAGSLGYQVYNSSIPNGWIVVSGTNVAAAQWAGMIALIKSGTHQNLANLNTLLYNAAVKKYALTYNPITEGSNGSCGYYCNAQAGYNYVTGLGTPQALFLAYAVIFND